MKLKPRKERVAGKDLHYDNDCDKRPINVAGTSRVGANNNDCAIKPINVAGTSRVGASSSDTARDVLHQQTLQHAAATARDRAGSANILVARDTSVPPWVKMAKAQRRVTPFSETEDEQTTNSLGRQRKPMTPDSEHDDVRRGNEQRDNNDCAKRPIHVANYAKNGASSRDTARDVLCQSPPLAVAVTERDRADCVNPPAGGASTTMQNGVARQNRVVEPFATTLPSLLLHNLSVDSIKSLCEII